MQKWEYLRYYWNYEQGHSSHGKYESIHQMVDDFGKVGWELVSVIPYISPYDIKNSYGNVVDYRTSTLAEIFYFKRPID